MCNSHWPAFRHVLWSTQDADFAAEIYQGGTTAGASQNVQGRVHADALTDPAQIQLHTLVEAPHAPGIAIYHDRISTRTVPPFAQKLSGCIRSPEVVQAPRFEGGANGRIEGSIRGHSSLQ